MIIKIKALNLSQVGKEAKVNKKEEDDLSATQSPSVCRSSHMSCIIHDAWSLVSLVIHTSLNNRACRGRGVFRGAKTSPPSRLVWKNFHCHPHPTPKNKVKGEKGEKLGNSTKMFLFFQNFKHFYNPYWKMDWTICPSTLDNAE